MITLTREEAQQVLDDIEAIAKADYRHWEELASLGEFERWARSRANHIAITLRAHLAQPEKEQEPVAWMCSDPELIRTGFKQFTDVKNSIWNIPVYAAPPQQQNQFNPDWDAMAVMVEEQQRMAKRIEELEAALRENEPVAWADKYDMDREGHDFWVSRQRPAKYGVPLYAAPFSTPDSATHSADSAGTFCNREWQGLTDEELFELWVRSPAETKNRFAFARAIEAKLKEKNNL